METDTMRVIVAIYKHNISKLAIKKLKVKQNVMNGYHEKKMILS